MVLLGAGRNCALWTVNIWKKIHTAGAVHWKDWLIRNPRHWCSFNLRRCQRDRCLGASMRQFPGKLPHLSSSLLFGWPNRPPSWACYSLLWSKYDHCYEHPVKIHNSRWQWSIGCSGSPRASLVQKGLHLAEEDDWSCRADVSIGCLSNMGLSTCEPPKL